MPCFDGRDRESNLETQRELDRVTDFLCRTLKEIEEGCIGSYMDLPKDILEWHRIHKKLDEQRTG